MSIPVKLNVPTFDIVVPSFNKKIKCRPFSVKEQKVLLMALEGGKAEDQLDTVKQILNNCVVKWNGIDIDSLATFDIEFIFMKIRARAKGSKIEIKFNGIPDSACEECQSPKTVSLDVDTIKIKTDPNHTKKIAFTDSVGVLMKYPKIDLLNVDIRNDVLLFFTLIEECVEAVYDADNVYPAKDYTKEELQEFIDTLSDEQFTKMYDFFETMPRLEHTIDLTCRKCGRKEEYVVKGFHDFFL